MNNKPDRNSMETLAKEIGGGQGTPEGQPEGYRAAALRRHQAKAYPKAGKGPAKSGLAADGATQEEQLQDTPGRPKSASSRQQTQPDQATQTGSSDLDSTAGS